MTSPDVLIADDGGQMAVYVPSPSTPIATDVPIVRILIAGIGNIFLGDDCFGVELARRLMDHPLPEEVKVVDFGIRSFDLAYAIMDGYETTILLDAVQRGGPPGTLYLIEPDLTNLDQAGELFDAHTMNPVSVLNMVKSFGGQPKQLFVIGCEPARLESEDGSIGLSETVAPSLDDAVEMTLSLVNQLLEK